MNLGEAARSAAGEIRAHQVRSLLSFLAVSVGAASLLYTLAQTRGMEREVARNLELMGPGALSVEARRDHKSRGLSPGLTYDDAAAIRAAMPELYMVSPVASTWNDAFYEGKRLDGGSVAGITPEWRRREWVYRLHGRFLNDYDMRTSARVCVLIEPAGWHKKPFWAKIWDWQSDFDKFASHHDLLGKDLVIGGHDFLVVGTLTPPPQDLDPRWQNGEASSVLIPLTAFDAYMPGGWGRKSGTIDSIAIDTGDERTIGPETRKIEALLKARHRGERDFKVKNRRRELEDSLREQNKYVAVALVLGLVALLSGGIGILNVTLAAVYSRVREIGVRRALGAERADVLALFLLEAALLGLAGGVAGVALGILGIDELAKAVDPSRVADPTWWHAAALIALSSAVAAAFAAYPAWLASRLDPVEALREEP
ncbi:MAG: ABC transporter permease [Elusimicrobia bacterium]|nr:ABC transporter permease [Elusimicrobiota bacterium]